MVDKTIERRPEIDVLTGALRCGSVTVSDLREGAVTLNRLPNADHVTLLDRSGQQTYWKVGASAARELHAYEILDEAGLAALHPEVLESDGSLLGVQALSGQTLGALPTTASLTPSFRRLGKLLAGLSSRSTGHSSPLVALDFLDPQRLNSKELSSGQLLFLREAITTAPELRHEFSRLGGSPVAMVHGDVRPENVLVDAQGDVRLIDWELSGDGWRDLDVATVLAHIFARRILHQLSTAVGSAEDRIRATADARALCEALLRGYGRSSIDPTAVSFAFVQLALELLAQRPVPDARSRFLLASAKDVLTHPHRWQLLLMPVK